VAIAKILFVDDDINLINGLRRAFRRKSSVWNLHFCSSAKDALLEMERQEFDLIISDMRMPDMDGAELLSLVAARHPQTIRFILSGYSNEKAVLKTIGPAHQYIAKPCQTTDIMQAIDRALDLKRILRSRVLKAIVSGTQNLPTPSETFTRLISCLDSDKSSASDVASIMQEDVALSTETLKLTNSAFFSLQEKVSNLKHAIAILGTATIKSILLHTEFYNNFSSDVHLNQQITRVGKVSFLTGFAAQSIADADHLEKENIENIFIAGVLSNIGILLLLKNKNYDYNKFFNNNHDNFLSLIECERKIFGASHAEIGAYLLGLWGFNTDVVEAVAFHHEPWHSNNTNLQPFLARLYVSKRLIGGEENEIENISDFNQQGPEASYIANISERYDVENWKNVILNIKKSDLI